jgi:hypothetical protein
MKCKGDAEALYRPSPWEHVSGNVTGLSCWKLLLLSILINGFSTCSFSREELIASNHLSVENQHGWSQVSQKLLWLLADDWTYLYRSYALPLLWQCYAFWVIVVCPVFVRSCCLFSKYIHFPLPNSASEMHHKSFCSMFISSAPI